MRDDPYRAGGADESPASLCLFDGLAPFFLDQEPGEINWSKIPFARLERDGELDPARAEAILGEFDQHVATMAGLGYNAVAIDDLAHLVDHDFYPAPLRRKLAGYRVFYHRLFAVARSHGLKLFTITDYMLFNPAIEQHLRESGQTPADLFVATVDAALAAFPELAGIALRIGESDGVDVGGDFTSRLTLRRPAEARALLQRLLPLFERHERTLIWRTWTLGAYQIGDLIWNRRTYDEVFGQTASPRMIVSLKYGPSDFFRYLELNPLFFHGPQRKIVELQCRREYEGMGEYPAFVGWRYADYLAALRAGGSNLVGSYAIQAGGWAPLTRLAFGKNGSLWNELNAYVTVKLVTTEASVAEIVAGFCRWRGIADPDTFLALLALSDQAIEEGLYIREFAARPRYFRRVRVPPLLWVFWTNVTVDGLIATLHRLLVRDKTAAVAEGHGAVAKVRAMIDLAARLGLPEDGLRFQLATFAILALLREGLLGVATPATRAGLAAWLEEYRRLYPWGYRFDYVPPVSAAPVRASRPMDMLIRLLIRQRMDCRRGDRLLLGGLAVRLRAAVVRGARAHLPRFVDKQGMSADTLLR
jgi:hypothetical protein